jgi:hypothetical protein
VVVSCDPANARDSFTGLAPTVFLKKAGFNVSMPQTNALATRLTSVATMLNVDLGGLLISPHCKRLIEAMDGGDSERGYHYKRHRISGTIDVVYSSVPEKNSASHIADALQYATLYINFDKQREDPHMRNFVYNVQKRNKMRRKIVTV